MQAQLFSFQDDISQLKIPSKFNNPFGGAIPAIAKIAAKQFQEFLKEESKNWKYNFQTRPGKMFGVLVVELPSGGLAFLGTISGYLDRTDVCSAFVPSVYQDEAHDYFLFQNMTRITEMGVEIEACTDRETKNELIKQRSRKSLSIQNELFEKYKFINIHGEIKSVTEIFQSPLVEKPAPAATGECAAPKLLQYAFTHRLKPLAIAEFWWGKTSKNRQRENLNYYPACKDKCKPILEFMLDDDNMYNKGLQERILLNSQS